MNYIVSYWGSEPGTADDNCHTGRWFETLDDARAAYLSDELPPIYATCTAFVELEGPHVYEVRPIAAYAPDHDDEDEWRSECARQAGMAFGVAGWNDYWGQS